LSYTAPSTHPPETLPVTSPSGPSTITDPGLRGADCQVSHTVATATVWPQSHQSASRRFGSSIRLSPRVRRRVGGGQSGQLVQVSIGHRVLARVVQWVRLADQRVV